jgi:hypothetical protein
MVSKWIQAANNPTVSMTHFCLNVLAVGVSNLPLPRSSLRLTKIVILITKPHWQNFLTGDNSSIDIC